MNNLHLACLLCIHLGGKQKKKTIIYTSMANVFDRVSVNGLGFGKEKRKSCQPFNLNIATHTYFISSYCFFPYYLLLPPSWFLKHFLTCVLLFAFTNTHLVLFCFLDSGCCFLLSFCWFVCFGHSWARQGGARRRDIL